MFRPPGDRQPLRLELGGCYRRRTHGGGASRQGAAGSAVQTAFPALVDGFGAVASGESACRSEAEPAPRRRTAEGGGVAAAASQGDRQAGCGAGEQLRDLGENAGGTEAAGRGVDRFQSARRGDEAVRLRVVRQCPGAGAGIWPNFWGGWRGIRTWWRQIRPLSVRCSSTKFSGRLLLFRRTTA